MATKKRKCVWKADWCTIRVPVAMRERLIDLKDRGVAPTIHGVIAGALDAADLGARHPKKRDSFVYRPRTGGEAKKKKARA